MKISGIYTITCLVNNKIYVGMAVDITHRWSKHVWSLNRGEYTNRHFQSAWNLYGKEKFSFEILEECEEQFMPSLENYWCNLLNTHNANFGYNIQPTGPHYRQGMAESTKEKLRKANLGKSPSAEARLKISKAHKGRVSPMKGRKHSQETKEKWKESIRKRGGMPKLTQKQKDRLREINIGRKHKEESFSWRYIPILQYTLEDIFIKEFPNIREANREVACSNGEISVVCKNNIPGFINNSSKRANRKSCKGFIWKYKNPENLPKEVRKIKRSKIQPSKNCYKKIIQLDIDNNVIKKWDSAKDIGIEFNTGPFNIRAACRKGNICNQFLWKYEIN